MASEPVSIHRLKPEVEGSDRRPDDQDMEPQELPEIIVIDIGDPGHRALKITDERWGHALKALGLMQAAVRCDVMSIVGEVPNDATSPTQVLDDHGRGATALEGLTETWTVDATVPHHAVVLGSGMGTVTAASLATPLARAKAAGAHLDIYVP